MTSWWHHHDISWHHLDIVKWHHFVLCRFICAESCSKTCERVWSQPRKVHCVNQETMGATNRHKGALNWRNHVLLNISPQNPLKCKGRINEIKLVYSCMSSIPYRGKFSNGANFVYFRYKNKKLGKLYGSKFQQHQISNRWSWQVIKRWHSTGISCIWTTFQTPADLCLHPLALWEVCRIEVSKVCTACGSQEHPAAGSDWQVCLTARQPGGFLPLSDVLVDLVVPSHHRNEDLVGTWEARGRGFGLVHHRIKIQKFLLAIYMKFYTNKISCYAE